MKETGNRPLFQPASRVFGLDRGQCIDRYYIERFLEGERACIRGRVLEVAESTYTSRFGGDRVTSSDVLHVEHGHGATTVVADLTRADQIDSDSFDCVILTQTLQHIYNLRAAVMNLYRILEPGGIVLATLPGISQISRYDMDRWGDFWRFTTLSARRLFEEAFAPDDLLIESHGNVQVAVAFLNGLAVHELKAGALEHHDPDYQMLITVRAKKPHDGRATRLRKELGPGPSLHQD